MADYVMMSLGSFVFSISTAAFQELERDNEWRWPAIDRLGVKPARQSVGPGEETVRLSGTIYPHFAAQRRGLDQMPALRALADESARTGTPLQLVDGTGRLWGDFVVMSLRERRTVFFSDGVPRCIEFDLTLGAYGGEEANVPDPVDVSGDPLSGDIPGIDDVFTSLEGYTSAGSLIDSFAGKMGLAVPNVRKLTAMTLEGLSEVKSLMTLGKNAISVARLSVGDGTPGNAFDLDNARRAAVGLMTGMNDLMSAASRAAFTAKGYSLDTILASAKTDGVSGVSRVAETIATIHTADGNTAFVEGLASSRDSLLVLKRMAEEAGG